MPLPPGRAWAGPGWVTFPGQSDWSLWEDFMGEAACTVLSLLTCIGLKVTSTPACSEPHPLQAEPAQQSWDVGTRRRGRHLWLLPHKLGAPQAGPEFGVPTAASV